MRKGLEDGRRSVFRDRDLNELKGYRLLLDGGMCDEKPAEWEELVDRVLCRLPPLHRMAEAAPWLLQLKQWQESNLFSNEGSEK